MDLKKKPALDRVRDLFVMACGTGLRYSDLSRLGPQHIINNAIVMRSHKTIKDTYIPLTPSTAGILNKYNMKLPRLSEQKMNKHLKDLCKMAEIDSPIEKTNVKAEHKTHTTVPKYKLITTHIGPKTFITHCGEKGISAKIGSKITGLLIPFPPHNENIVAPGLCFRLG